MANRDHSVRAAQIVVAAVGSFALLESTFRFWLFFPGFFQFDDWMSATLPGSVNFEQANHTHLLFISFVLNSLYRLFGYHTWYVLALNLLLWHVGVAIVVAAVYRITKSRHALWILSLTFLPAAWIYLPLYWKDFTFGLLVWLSTALCLLATTFGPLGTSRSRARRMFYWGTVVLILMMALYWRHNAIVTVAPLFVFLVHRAVMAKGRLEFGSRGYIGRVLVWSSVVGTALAVMVAAHPALFGKPGQAGMTRHILLHDMIGISALTGRDQIPRECYLPGVTFEKVRAQYAKTPTNIDAFIWGRMLDEKAAVDLNAAWWSSVWRYPSAFLRHKSRLARSLLLKVPWVPQVRDLEADLRVTWADRPWFVETAGLTMGRFPRHEQKIMFSVTRRTIVEIAISYTRRLHLPMVWYLVSSVVGLILVTTQLLRRGARQAAPERDRAVLGACLFLAALASIAVIVSFAPHPSFRYVFPAVPTTVLGWLALVFSRQRNERS